MNIKFEIWERIAYRIYENPVNPYIPFKLKFILAKHYNHVLISFLLDRKQVTDSKADNSG